MNDSIKIHVMHTGLVKVDKALPFHGTSRNPLAFTGLLRGEHNKIILPVSSYLIEHPKGLILIDTGWNKLIRQSIRKELSWQTLFNTGYLPFGWAVDERIAKWGYTPKDIDYVLMSHLHSDHASGLRLVKGAKQIITSSEEWKVANRSPMGYLPKEWQDIDIKTYDYEKTNLGPFGRSFDLFGDGSILQIYTPGHTPGLSATLVRGSNGKYVLLAADVGYATRSWEEMLIPGISVDRAQAIQSLSWVKEMSENKDCLEVIANHDPKTKQHSIILPY